MSSNINRRPSLFFRTPPFPRTPSVTRMPRTLGGQIMPVGWNWTISMSSRSAPTPSAMAMPSPVYSHEFGARDKKDPLPLPPPVAERAADGVAVLEQALDGALHEHVDPLVHRVV